MNQIAKDPTMREKIKAMAAGKSYTQIAREFGVERRTISRIVNSDKKVKKMKPRDFRLLRPDHILERRRREEDKILEPGCLNVFDRVDWLTG